MESDNKSGVVKERTQGGLLIRKGDCPAADMLAAIERHNLRMKGRGTGRSIKRDENTWVSIVPHPSGGRLLFVKEYRYRGRMNRLKDLIRPSQPLREWKAARKLAERGVNTPETLALLIAPATTADASHYMIARALPNAVRVCDYILRIGDPRELRRFVDRLADFMADLNRRRVVHGDMKASNLLVVEEEGGPHFYIVDLASARFRSPRRSDIELMLAQLYASIPLEAGRTIRLRFLIRYLESAGRAEARSRPARRKIARQAVKLGESRNPVWRR